jgi:hypothetical protein
MRKGVLGSIAALTAGAGLAFGQGPGGAGSPLLPATGQSSAVPPLLGGADGPAVIPVPEAGPNGAPVYPPPGLYGSTPYQLPSGSVNGHTLAPHWWVNSEYLLWWVKSQPANFPYITTGARAEGGVIGGASTTVLVGDCNYGYGLFSGFRVTGGWFKDECRRVGFEFSGFLLGKQNVTFFAQSDANGVPVLARPFVNATNGAQGVLTVSFPNLASGSILFKTDSQSWGAEGSGVLNLYRSCPDDKCLISINGIGGFRYFELDEDIDVASSSTLLGTNTTSFAGLTVAAPATISVHDRVETTNRFYGGQVGLKAEASYGKWYVSTIAKFAIGEMNETLLVDGQSSVLDPTRGIAAVNPGGLLANPSTICTLRKDQFVYIPEGQINFGYNWCSWLTTYVGYNVIYVSKVIRPGDQITNVVNPALIPTSPSFGNGPLGATPNVQFTQSEFWLTGVSFGIVMRY